MLKVAAIVLEEININSGISNYQLFFKLMNKYISKGRVNKIIIILITNLCVSKINQIKIKFLPKSISALDLLLS